MKLTNVCDVKQLMEKFGIHFKKQYGQNFLLNETVLQEIAENADRGVLEIGPGIGSLTQVLCEHAEKVVSIEIDTALLPVLEYTLAEYDHAEVVHADVMKVDLPALVKEKFGDLPVSVCANLPYYITSPILMLLLESKIPFTNITVMIQKEVAQRLCAKAGDADYGAITAVVSYYAKVRKLFDVAPGNFLPPPKVTSTVISIEPYKNSPYHPKSEAVLFRVIKGAFAQRRKTLRNTLGGAFSQYSKEELAQKLQSVGISPDRRGETLSIEEFIKIADAMFIQ